MTQPTHEQKLTLSKNTFNRPLKRKQGKKQTAAELDAEQAHISDVTQARLRMQFYKRNPHARVAAK